MPLILQAAIAWAAGTALGLSSARVAGWLLLLALLALGTVWAASHDRTLSRAGRVGHREQAAALALLAAAGLVLGHDLRMDDLRCAAEARASKSWRVELLGPAAPGSFVRGRLADVDCHVAVAVAVRRGEAAAGSVVVARGAELTQGERGLLLRDANLTRLRGPDALARWRNGVAERLDRLYATDAPMVRALLIADTRGLSPELRERYADAGLVHILSISGLHVAIVGGALLLVLGVLRLRPAVASLGAVGLTVLYVVAIGAPPPAVRSATLFAATQATRLWQRPVSPWGSYALGALMPLVEPRTVLDLGWQLSVSGYAAIIVSGRLGRRLPPRWRGLRANLSRELITGVLTTLVTAPLVAWHFGRLSLVAAVSNLAAGPVVSLLQPTLFAAMVWPERLGAAFIADASRPMLRMLDAVAFTAASVPGAAVVVAPTPVATLLALAMALAVLVAGWVRHPARALSVALGATALLVWSPDPTAWRPSPARGLEVHLLDVGQGDAIAVRTPRGRWILMDAGRSWRAGDAGRSTVIPYLRRRGGELAMFVLSHPHADHVGGAASVLRALRPRELRDAAFVEPNASYLAALATARQVGARWQRVRPGEALDVDGVLLEFLAPDSAWTAALRDPNEASTVLRLRYGNVRLLLTGDAESAEEAWLLQHAPGALEADILKVAHHGSRTSTTPAFVERVRPRIALVSVGAANTYGHPSPEVMRRLVDQGATVLRTDQLGTVVVRSDGTRLEVEAAGHRWIAAAQLPETP